MLCSQIAVDGFNLYLSEHRALDIVEPAAWQLNDRLQRRSKDRNLIIRIAVRRVDILVHGIPQLSHAPLLRRLTMNYSHPVSFPKFIVFISLYLNLYEELAHGRRDHLRLSDEPHLQKTAFDDVDAPAHRRRYGADPAAQPASKQMLPFFSKLPPCLIGVEACGTAHHWARTLSAMGHEVRLIPPSYVKAFVKRGKSDALDAQAISETVQRPTMQFVPVKTVPAGYPHDSSCPVLAGPSAHVSR